jgi:hypothetical protein
VLQTLLTSESTGRSMSNATIQAIEDNIKQARKLVEVGEALERLKNNRDFKKVMIEGYFEQEAIRLVHLKSDQNVQSPDMQKSINSQIDAIGAVSQYFSTVLHKASIARKAIASDEEARDEILEEELNNG